MPKIFEKIEKSYEQIQIEEMRKGSSLLASLMFGYYQELMKNGFSEQGALYLVAQYQNTIINPRNKIPEDHD